MRAAGRVVVAFSGGVDSSYLAFAAHRALGSGALAVTAESPSYPASHRAMAERVVARVEAIRIGDPLDRLAVEGREVVGGDVGLADHLCSDRSLRRVP
mgnify:CR=1 FL=1